MLWIHEFSMSLDQLQEKISFLKPVSHVPNSPTTKYTEIHKEFSLNLCSKNSRQCREEILSISFRLQLRRKSVTYFQSNKHYHPLSGTMLTFLLELKNRHKTHQPIPKFQIRKIQTEHTYFQPSSPKLKKKTISNLESATCIQMQNRT